MADSLLEQLQHWILGPAESTSLRQRQMGENIHLLAGLGCVFTVGVGREREHNYTEVHSVSVLHLRAMIWISQQSEVKLDNTHVTV